MGEGYQPSDERFNVIWSNTQSLLRLLFGNPSNLSENVLTPEQADSSLKNSLHASTGVPGRSDKSLREDVAIKNDSLAPITHRNAPRAPRDLPSPAARPTRLRSYLIPKTASERNR